MHYRGGGDGPKTIMFDIHQLADTSGALDPEGANAYLFFTSRTQPPTA